MDNLLKDHRWPALSVAPTLKGGGWPALSVAPTLKGAPSKLRLGGGFLCGPHDRESSEALPRPCCPLRLDFHATLFARQIVAETRPWPVFRTVDESPCHGIAMNVAQLLGELALAPHVEVVVARLPEGLRGAQRQLARDRLLQRLQGLCEAALFRFAYQ